MSFYTLHEEGGRLVVRRERTDGLRFVLHAHTDRLVDLVSYKAFKHFTVPSFLAVHYQFCGTGRGEEIDFGEFLPKDLI